jgi:hypothetical protein
LTLPDIISQEAKDPVSMRNRGFLPAGFLLFLSAGLLARGPSSFPGKVPGQDQPERPKFYALRAVSEKNVQNAEYSLGVPDDRYTEILPGGQLVLLMEKELYLFILSWSSEGVATISGLVVGKGGADFALECWSPWQDTEGKQHHDWMPALLSAAGFSIPVIDWGLISYCFDSSTSFKGNTGVNMIRITNPGTESLFVDAVIGYDREAGRR